MFLLKASICSLIAVLAAPSVLAQRPGNPGNTGNPGTPGTTPAPRPPVVAPPRPNIPNRTASGNREPGKLFFLTGRVVFDDGTVPTEPVNIERVCEKRTWREGHTDSSGNFSIQLGQNIGDYQDASIDDGGMGDPLAPRNGAVTENQLNGCELRANYPGALSDSLPLAGRHAMDDTNVGTIVLHRMGKVEGTKVSVTSLQAPKKAKSALEHAKKAAARQKWPEAQRDLEKAVAIYPAYAEAWSLLGICYNELQRPADASHAFQEAQQADSRYMEPYFQLSVIAARDQNWVRLAELTDKALTLDAYEYPALYYYNALADWHLNRLDAAEKSARAARRLDSQYRIPTIELMLAMIFLQRQDYPAAAQQFREYLKRNPTGPEADEARARLSDLERRLAVAEKK